MDSGRGDLKNTRCQVITTFSGFLAWEPCSQLIVTFIIAFGPLVPR